ncbi:MAG TPA: chromate efflux transporter [Pirellulaceae bacterium]|nr:chromate efflux transporter [Pirellulaceae bacterium]
MSKPSLSVESPPVVSWSEAFWTWARIAALSFGGPSGQIAVMHRVIVEEKNWVSEERFLHALNYCMLLPGPEAQQLAVYLGWLMHRLRGGLMAGGLFILPGFVSLMLLSIVYALYQQTGIVTAIFLGLKPAVMAVVIEAVWRISRRVLKNRVMVAIAACAFVAVFFFQLPFPIVVLSAGILGFFGGIYAPRWFVVVKGHSAAVSSSHSPPLLPDGIELPHTRPSWRKLLATVGIGLLIWWGPLVALMLWLGTEHVFVVEGLYFSRAAMVTFGGAYAVLTYVAQDAVERYHWLAPGEMVDGLGMAETTPGPLIMVLQFVGFLGAYRLGPTQSPELSPLVCGMIGACISVWVTFVPCFIWIFAGAPYIEQTRNNKLLSAALSSITSAVVGCVLNLAIWFALHTLFGTVSSQRWGWLRILTPQWNTLSGEALLITVFACVLLFWLRRGMLTTLLGSMTLGIVLWLLSP